MEMHSPDAGEILEQALQEMNGIIQGVGFDITPSPEEATSVKLPGSCDDSSKLSHASNTTYSLPLDLSNQPNSISKRTSKLMQDLRIELERADSKPELLSTIPHHTVKYLVHWFSNNNASKVQTDDERVKQLESDHESLTLQVCVLSEQVDAQTEKILELEQDIHVKENKRANAENRLKNELLSRTTLETHKLDLMAEVSSLKLRLATAEKQRQDIQDKYDQSLTHIEVLEQQITDRDVDIAELKVRLARNGMLSPNNDADDEVDKLKKAVESLAIENDDKDKKIGDLRKMLKRYKRIEEMLIQAQGKKALEGLYLDDISDTSSTGGSTTDRSTTSGQNDNKDKTQIEDGVFKPILPYYNMVTSTPVHGESPILANEATPVHNISMSRTLTPKKSPSLARSSSCEDIVPAPNKMSPQRQGYGTLPSSKTDKIQPVQLDTKRSQAQTEVELEIHDLNGANTNNNEVKEKQKKTKGSIRRFFGSFRERGSLSPDIRINRTGRMKRSGSQEINVEDGKLGEFKRGGVRATAGARLAWSKDLKRNDGMDRPFQRRDGEQLSYWLHDMGLTMYVADCKRWVKNGQQLLQATTHELEKELGIRNHFHRKKLQLALQSVGSGVQEKYAALSYEWVTRWLDDVGLPQYKSHFLEARVDGRMLHYLTVEDLVNLKISNTLHHLSVKRAIQVLRLNQWNTACLKRRPTTEDKVRNAPQEVMLWTNHRVMEWLRTIDLSEYAPNLRGSGVHGALMVLEDRFNAEKLAALLSIPTNKTLLRRHLFTHFVDLIGQDVQQKKREYEASPIFQPLVTNSKIKVMKKRSLFGHRRRNSELEADDLVCPMDAGHTLAKVANGNKHSETDIKSAKRIGALSQELNTLTDMLAKDVQTSDV